jgi:hypothetical protein
MKWEYKVVFLAADKGYAPLAPKLDNELNKLGADGWGSSASPGTAWWRPMPLSSRDLYTKARTGKD